MSWWPWRQNPWFETVLEAQRRAKRRLPPSVYAALVAGSERGATPRDNTDAFAELEFAPHVAGHQAQRDLSTTVLGIPISLPVLISPTGVQAVDPEGEVAVARAAAARGTIMGLSSFASKPVEQVVEANPNTFYQLYWTGSKEQMVQRMDRARAAGANYASDFSASAEVAPFANSEIYQKAVLEPEETAARHVLAEMVLRFF